MIDIMGTLLERPMIKKDFDEKYPTIVSKMHDMLDEAKLMYDAQVSVMFPVFYFQYFQ